MLSQITYFSRAYQPLPGTWGSKNSSIQHEQHRPALTILTSIHSNSRDFPVLDHECGKSPSSASLLPVRDLESNGSSGAEGKSQSTASWVTVLAEIFQKQRERSPRSEHVACNSRVLGQWKHQPTCENQFADFEKCSDCPQSITAAFLCAALLQTALAPACAKSSFKNFKPTVFRKLAQYFQPSLCTETGQDDTEWSVTAFRWQKRILPLWIMVEASAGAPAPWQQTAYSEH